VRLVASAIPDLLGAMGIDAAGDLARSVEGSIEPVRIAAGATLFEAGSDPDAAYLVVTGRLLVTDREGNPIRRLGRGQIVGEIGLIEGTARTATVLADRDTILARLPATAFDRLAAERPEFLMGVARTLVRRLLHPRPPTDTVGSVAVAVTSTGIDPRIFTGRMLQGIEGRGAAAHLSSAAVDALLGAPGASQQPPGTPEALLVGERLDLMEAEHRFLILETDREPTPWTVTALRRADRAVVVIGTDPTPEEEAAAGRLVAEARTGNRREVWVVAVRPDDAGPPRASAALAARLGADRVLHARAGSSADVARVGRLATGTGIGLVLGGGGARGFAHIGVYRALTELGVPVDAVAGASIGGVMAAAIAVGMSPDEMTRVSARRFRKVLDYTLPVVSLVKGARITREIEAVFGGMDIEDLVIPYLCVSTDLTTSRAVAHDRGPVTPAIRAGLAIPGVIPPVPHEGNLLVDGGVLDNLPLEPLRSAGLVDTIVAVDVAPPLGPRAREDFGLSVSGWRALRSRMGRHKRRYPAISPLLLRSMIVGSRQHRDRLVAEGYADLLLEPELRGISLLAFDRVEEVARAGYEAAAPEIEAWLAARGEER